MMTALHAYTLSVRTGVVTHYPWYVFAVLKSCTSWWYAHRIFRPAIIGTYRQYNLSQGARIHIHLCIPGVCNLYSNVLLCCSLT